MAGEAERVAKLEAQMDNLVNEMERLRDTIERLTATINQWKGGVALLVVLSGALGAALSKLVSLAFTRM